MEPRWVQKKSLDQELNNYRQQHKNLCGQSQYSEAKSKIKQIAVYIKTLCENYQNQWELFSKSGDPLRKDRFNVVKHPDWRLVIFCIFLQSHKTTKTNNAFLKPDLLCRRAWVLFKNCSNVQWVTMLYLSVMFLHYHERTHIMNCFDSVPQCPAAVNTQQVLNIYQSHWWHLK